ncbi:MAG: hypothetical protein ACM3QS_17190 [Bacteroidota bacterium]
MKKLIYFSILAATLLAACGPQATPTMSPEDVQATAFSSASTMVALTEAALPTATPVPSTPTASPTTPPTATQQQQVLPTLATQISLPTIPPTPVPGGTDNCVHPLDMGEAGPTRPVVVENETGGSLNLSLNLWKPNDFGQCGAISYANVAKGASFTVQLPSGYWFAYAWITLKGSSSEASGSFYIQLANTDKQRLIIDKDVIVLKP